MHISCYCSHLFTIPMPAMFICAFYEDCSIDLSTQIPTLEIPSELMLQATDLRV